MLNLITNLSLWLLFIRSHWSIFTLFQFPEAISCNCIKARVSANHPSSLAWHAEHPLSWNTPACASLALQILVLVGCFSDSIDLEYFYCELDISNTSSRTHPFSHLQLGLLYVRIQLYLICTVFLSVVTATVVFGPVSGQWWHICTYTVCSRRVMCIVLR